MALSDTIREIFSPEPLRGELTPVGLLDRLAGIGLVAAGVLYVIFFTFGGPIRGVLGSGGLAPLIYVPALLGVPALLANMLTRVGDPRTSVATLAVLAFIAIESVISFFIGRAPGAIIFQLYIFIPGFIMMALTQRGMQERLIRTLAPMFYIAAVGVLLNVFIEFPWAHASFEVLGTEKEAAREWTAGGMSRLAGFTRASTTAASQILIGYCVVEHRLRSLMTRGIWWAVGLVAIYYTTSKAPMLAMATLPAAYVIIGRIRATDAARRQLAANLLMAFWVLLIFAGPLLALTYGKTLYPGGPGFGSTYSSLADRVLNTWPSALGLVDWSNPVNWVVGRGLGGIGGAQAIFEPMRYNPADNLAIYLFVIFGAGSLLIAYLIIRGGQRAIASEGRGRRDFAMIIAMLGIGSAANVIEATAPMLVLGLAMARQVTRTRPVRDAETGTRRRRRRSDGSDRAADAAAIGLPRRAR